MKRPNVESPRAQKSIFHPYRDCRPLQDLVGDDGKGWRVERNLLKCLNHLPLLLQKEEIAERLGLHNMRTPQDVFEKNYLILVAHHRGEMTTGCAVSKIAANVGMQSDEAESLLRDYIPVGHMEFHPSDKCNLRCLGCTYGQGVEGLCPKQVDFPYDCIERLSKLNPRSLLFSGGGEPSLYNYRGKQMDELVTRLCEILPRTLLALITNGTHVPKGEWIRYFKWVRISIDAATPETYETFKRKPFFERVERNLLAYLQKSLSIVGGSFLYSKANIHEYVPFVRHFYELVRREKPYSLPRFNLSFRPLRQNPNDVGRDFPEMISESDVDITVQQIREFAAESPEIEHFMRVQTNIEAVLGGSLQPALPFQRCYYSQIFHIVRADGDVRPCFVRVLEPEFSMGNLITGSVPEISLRSMYIAAIRQRYCNPEGCRQCHVNYILEQGLKGVIKPSDSLEVLQDPFF